MTGDDVIINDSPGNDPEIKHKFVDISLFTDSVPQEAIACEVVTNNDNSLIIACVYRSPNSTADNTNSLN